MLDWSGGLLSAIRPSSRRKWQTLKDLADSIEMQYLSEEWLLKANDLVGALAPVNSDLVIGFETLGGPDGDRRHEVKLGPDCVEVRPDHSKPHIVLTLQWETATAIAKGELSAQRVFLDGTMSLKGDAAALVGHQDAFAAVSDSLAELRHKTNYA